MKRSTLVLMLTFFVFAALGLASFAMAGQGTSQTQATTEQAPAAKKMPVRHAARVQHLTLTGTLMMVDAQKRLVIVTDSYGVPFDLKVTRGTRIRVEGKRARLDDLSSETNKQVTVSFVEMGHAGNIARTIEIGG